MVQHDLYLTEPIYFLRSATVKFQLLADIMRSTWINPEYADIVPESVNPYYRHLCGDYILPDDTTMGIPNKVLYTKFDEMIYVNSFDVQGKQIEFTRENLLKHPKTKNWYKFPHNKISKLCKLYPLQTDLIKNILYPAGNLEKIDDLINAKDLSLLSYDEELLEQNERFSIIEALTHFLDMVRERWLVKEYRYEHLYPLVLIDIIWTQMYNCIITQRVLNIRTPNVHSYHLWEYLKSKGLKDYRDVLSTNKSLFLYRNIDHLLREQGTRETLSKLIGALLTDINLEIRQKAILQCTESKG